MRKSLMDFVKYQNTCSSCGTNFTTQGWMRHLCRKCLGLKRQELREIARQNALKSYTTYSKEENAKCPQIGYGHCGLYKGLFCQSTWELAVAAWAFDEKLSIKRSPRIIYYTFEGKQHRYHPDFEIEGVTYEIKGRVTPQEIAKQLAAKEQGIQIIFIDELACDFYFEYVYSRHGLHPKWDYKKLYDKKIVTVKSKAQENVNPKRYSLFEIMKQQNHKIKKEWLLNHSPFFRDKKAMSFVILRAENEIKPSIEYIKLLKEAMQFLYS